MTQGVNLFTPPTEKDTNSILDWAIEYGTEEQIIQILDASIPLHDQNAVLNNETFIKSVGIIDSLSECNRVFPKDLNVPSCTDIRNEVILNLVLQTK